MVSKALSLCSCYPLPEGVNNDNENDNENENENEDEKMSDNKKARNFRNYKVWMDSVDYATSIYKQTDSMPWFEKKGICDQIRRAAVSISSNIAEGCAKPSDLDFAHFLDMALGSSYEVETQLLISKNVGYLEDNIYDKLQTGIIDIERQLSGLIRSLRQSTK